MSKQNPSDRGKRRLSIEVPENNDGLVPQIQISSATSTTDSLLSPTNSPPAPNAGLLSPSIGLLSPIPANITPSSARSFGFSTEEIVISSGRSDSSKYGPRLSLSKTLGNAITDIDRDGSLLQKTIRSKTLLSGDLEQQPLSAGFRILTQEEAQQKYDQRSVPEKEFNISNATIETLKNIATLNEIVIITRPVNSTALTLMKEGAVGKNMFVHGKSAAEDSLAAGLITLNAGSSKAGRDNNSEKIKSYNAENRESLQKSQDLFDLAQGRLQGAAQKISSKLNLELENLDKKFQLTEQEIRRKAEIEKELKEGPTEDKLLQEAKIPSEYFDQMVSAVPVLDKKGNQIYVFEDQFEIVKKDGKYQIHAIEEDGKLYFIDKNHEHNAIPQKIPDGYKKVPLQVMGKPDITIGKDGSLTVNQVRPITADIDVLAYGAKVNLQKFDKMPSYQEVVAAEKEQLLKSFTLPLTQEAKDKLVNDKIDAVLQDARLIPDSLKQDTRFTQLAEKFKDIEVQREHLKGMGSAPEFVTAITGAMRAEFKDSVEISHNSEQFNIGFTQALDDKWVLIEPGKDKANIISGEKELLEAFSRFRAEGLSMPPNPNWGWELKEGKYEKNKDLVEISASCQQLSFKIRSLEEDYEKAQGVEKEKISKNITLVTDIFKLQTETGLIAITEPRDSAKLTKSIQNLYEKLEDCLAENILTAKDIDQIKKYKQSRSEIYDLSYDSKNVAKAAEKIINSLTSRLDGTLRTGNKQLLAPISQGRRTTKDPLLEEKVRNIGDTIRAFSESPRTNQPNSGTIPLRPIINRSKNSGRGFF